MIFPGLKANWLFCSLKACPASGQHSPGLGLPAMASGLQRASHEGGTEPRRAWCPGTVAAVGCWWSRNKSQIAVVQWLLSGKGVSEGCGLGGGANTAAAISWPCASPPQWSCPQHSGRSLREAQKRLTGLLSRSLNHMPGVNPQEESRCCPGRPQNQPPHLPHRAHGRCVPTPQAVPSPDSMGQFLSRREAARPGPTAALLPVTSLHWLGRVHGSQQQQLWSGPCGASCLPNLLPYPVCMY